MVIFLSLALLASLAYIAWLKWGHRLRSKTAQELEEIANELRGDE